MARKKLSMRKTKEVLRLKYEQGLAIRQIACACGMPRSTVADYVRRAQGAGIQWPLSPEIDERKLDELLFGVPGRPAANTHSLPDMAYVRKELQRKGVTLQLLWQEHKQSHPEGYQYSWFCARYREWVQTLNVCLRQEYKAGEKLFVDYAGQKIPLIDPITGTVHYASLFVAVLGASNYTYAEATRTEQLPDWIQSHIHTFEYIGGVPRIVIPDNLKSGVSKVCRYEPDLNPTYADMAQHYRTAVIPARVGKPQDKAKVEAGVQIAERWILAVLRHQKFFSLAELNNAIRELLAKLNQKPFKKLEGSRIELFKELDAPALKALPERRYEYAEWKKARVNIDSHVEVDCHYYSVPYALVHQVMDVRLTAGNVEIMHKGHRVAAHLRSYEKWKYTTLDEHRPKSHREHLAWTPSRMVEWLSSIGTSCGQVARLILESKTHPELGYRTCLGLVRLSKAYGVGRMEAACLRALTMDACSYRSIKSILKSKFDMQPLPGQEITLREIVHSNIRGKSYYENCTI